MRCANDFEQTLSTRLIVKFLFVQFLVLLILVSTQTYGGEARRCLRDGKVIVTDVGCEFLGNATDLAPPTPNRHFKRGEPNGHPVAAPVPETKAVISPPVDPAKQQATNALWQLYGNLFEILLIPFLLITILAAWLSQKTKNASPRYRCDDLPKAGWKSSETRGSKPSESGKVKEARISRREPTFSPEGHAANQQHTSPNNDQEVRVSANSSAVDDELTSVDPKPAEWCHELIHDLEWKRFEDVCQQIYEKKGIRSETTPLGPDGGIDIRLYQDDSGQPTAIVQCKAWGGRYVGVKPVRELLGVMTHEKIAKGFFMTSGLYSEEAKAVAQANRITLIDGTLLLAMIQRLSEKDREDLLIFATQGDFKTPTCPSCGNKMEKRSGINGRPDFWGCPRYPQCRQKLGMRRV